MKESSASRQAPQADPFFPTGPAAEGKHGAGPGEYPAKTTLEVDYPPSPSSRFRQHPILDTTSAEDRACQISPFSLALILAISNRQFANSQFRILNQTSARPFPVVVSCLQIEIVRYRDVNLLTTHHYGNHVRDSYK